MPGSLAPTRSGSAPTASRLQRRLWRAAGAMLAIVLSTLLSGGVYRLRGSDPRLFLGYDLLPSYTAGRLVREGHADSLYDSTAFQEAEARVIREANLRADARYAPWLNPPFYAWAFAPLSALPYRQAAVVALAASLLLAAGSLVLLVRMLPAGAGWRTWGLLPACLVAFAPFWEVLLSLQNTFLSLLMLCATATFWRRGQGLRAGLVAGLLLFKPQLAAVVAVVLAASLGWRAAAGLAATSAALLLVNIYTLPGSLAAFIHHVPPIVRHLQEESPYNWGRQATFQSFWRLALQGHATGPTGAAAKLLWTASATVVLASLGWAVWRGRCDGDGRQTPYRLDRLIGAAVASIPLLMPYYMEYDLLLLAVSAVLFAAEHCRSTQDLPASRANRRLVQAWIALFISVNINPLVAGATRLNLAVPLLALVSGLSLARCLRNGRASGKMPPEMKTEAGRADNGNGGTMARAA